MDNDEFEQAFVDEMAGDDTPPTTDDTPPTTDDTPPVDEDEPATPPEDEEPEGEDEPEGEEEQQPEGEDEKKVDEPEEEQQPQPMTAEDVKAAMREYSQETQSRVDSLSLLRDEIIKTAYPDGIDSNVYDSDGNIIKTAQDIVDRGLLKSDGEPFTYEEAASFMLEAGRQSAENMDKMRDWADGIAETNQSLMEGNERVMAEWGEMLNSMPEVAKELADAYINTQLEFDKTNSYITRMGMSPEQFYKIAMSPYKQLNDSMAAQRAAEEALAERQTASQQQERNGLPPQRGTSKTKANTGDPMLDALVDELAKG